MALAATVAWEVRTTGNDSNSGGFNTASAGTDYSQQDTPHVVFDGTVIFGTTAATSAIITIHGYVVSAADIGNILKITGGTNFNAGNYQVNAVNTGTNTWTMDKAVSTGAGLAMTGNMGGGFLTIAHGLASFSVGDQTVYIQSGTYNISSTLTTPNFAAGHRQNRMIGYVTNHATIPQGASRPVIDTDSNAIIGLTVAGSNGWYIQNLIIQNTANGTTGINDTSNFSSLSNLKVSKFATGVILPASSYLYNCEVTGNTTAGVTSTGSVIVGCWIHDMTCVGISNATNAATVIDCLITNCTGATSDGILSSSLGGTFIGNTIYGSGRDGLRLTSADALAAMIILNNIFANNTGFGLDIVTAQTYNTAAGVDYNGYYSNTAGDRNNVTIGPHGVPMTQSPFTNPGGNDFSINNVLNGGASLRNAGFPGALPGLPGISGFSDIGVYRHQDVTSVTNNLYVLAYD